MENIYHEPLHCTKGNRTQQRICLTQHLLTGFHSSSIPITSSYNALLLSQLFAPASFFLPTLSLFFSLFSLSSNMLAGLQETLVCRDFWGLMFSLPGHTRSRKSFPPFFSIFCACTLSFWFVVGSEGSRWGPRLMFTWLFLSGLDRMKKGGKMIFLPCLKDVFLHVKKKFVWTHLVLLLLCLGHMGLSWEILTWTLVASASIGKMRQRTTRVIRER